MSQHRQQFHMGGGGGGHNAGGHFGDTTFTKIFVGGLAWETQRETMRRYFEQFGEIQEAVVITDKNTGRSKGYGFVTFKDPESATRACHDPSPVIDGRRANCNLASLGAQSSTRPTTPHQHGRYRPVSGGPPVLPPAAYHQGQGGSSSAYFHQPAQYALPYGYSGYSQENMYPMSYYSVYGGQHYSPYYATPPPAPAAAAAPSTPHSGAGIYPNFIPYYPQYAQPSQTQGFGIQYPQLIQYPYLPHHYTTATTAVLSLPASVPSVVPSATSSTNGTGTSQTAVATKTTTEQTSSST